MPNVGEATNPTPPPGAVQYQNMVAASDVPTALAWKQQESLKLLQSGQYTPKDIDAYWGDSDPHDATVAGHVADNLAKGLPGASYHNADPVHAFAAGLGMSVSGLPLTHGNVDQAAPTDGMLSTVARAGGQALGDMPMSIAGFFGGLVAGSAGGATVGSAVPVVGTAAGAATGGVVGAGFGMNALPTAVREAMLDSYNSGNIKNWQDFTHVLTGSVLRTLQSGSIGAVSNLVGGKAGEIAAEAGANKLVSGLAATSANAGTGVAAGAAMEGHIPSKDEFVAAGITALVMHGLGEGGTMIGGRFTANSAALKVQNNLETLYRQTGITPQEAVSASAQDPAIRREIFGQDVNGEPNLAASRATAKNEPEPYVKPNPEYTSILPTKEQEAATVAQASSKSSLPSAGSSSTATPKASPLPSSSTTAIPSDPVERAMTLFKTAERSGPQAISPKGAAGTYQIMPGTARQYMGPDFDVSTLLDPKVNETVARKIASDLTRRYPGDDVAQLVAYNAGPGRANQLVTKGPGTRLEATPDPTVRGGIRYDSVPSGRDESFLPEETQRYIAYSRLKGNGHVAEGEGQEGHWPNPDNHIEAFNEREPETETEGGGGGGAPPPGGQERIAGPEAEKPEVNWWKNTSEENLTDEMLRNVGEETDKTTPLGRQVERYFSELAPARNIDTRLIKESDGALDRNRDFMAEDGFRLTYSSDARAGLFSRAGRVDPISLEVVPNTATDTMATKVMRENGGTIQGLKAWMIASRVVDLEARGIKSGFNIKAAAALRAMKSAGGKYGDAFKLLDMVNDGVLQYGKESGLYNDARIAAMKAAAPSGFVSFRRIMGDDASFDQAKARSKFGVRDPLARMEGSDRQITDPITAMLDNRRMVIRMADRNRAIGQIVGMVESHPEVAADLGLLKLEFNSNAAISEAAGEAFKPYGIEPTEENVQAFSHLLAEKVAKSWGPNEFAFYRDGKLERWTTKDPELAELIKKVSSPQEADLAIKVVGGIAAVQRSGIVLDPTFVPRVLLRHQDTAYVYDPLHPPPYVTMMRGVFAALKNPKLFEDVMAKGGYVSLASMDRDYLQRDIEKTFTDTGVWDNVANAFKHPIQFSQAIHEALDATQRLGYNVRARQMGIDPRKAAMMGRKAYLDYTEQATSEVANRMSKNVPFFRPAMLGLKQAAEAFESGDVKKSAIVFNTVKAVGLGILAPSLTLYALNYMADKYLPDGQKYQDLPRWIRDQYFVTPPINGIRMKLKYPPILGFPLGGLMNRALDAMIDHDPHAMDGAFQALISDALPPLAPSFLTPPIENITNYSFHSGKSLVPASVEKADGYMQYTANTSETAKALAKILGPTRMNVPGLNQTNPEQIENLINGWSGTLGIDALHAIDAFMKPHVQLKTIADNPFVGSFFARQDGTQSQGITDFYTDMSRLEKRNTDFKMAIKQQDTGNVADTLKLGGPVYPKLLQLHEGVQRAMSVINGINEDKSMSTVEKRQAIDQVMPQIVQMARAGTMMIKEVEKNFKGAKVDLPADDGTLPPDTAQAR